MALISPVINSFSLLVQTGCYYSLVSGQIQYGTYIQSYLGLRESNQQETRGNCALSSFVISTSHKIIFFGGEVA
jgi:hypothetical protein